MALGAVSFCMALIFFGAVTANMLWEQKYDCGDSRNPALLWGFAPINYLALFYGVRCIRALKHVDPNSPKGLAFDFAIGVLTIPGIVMGILAVLFSPFIVLVFIGNLS